MWEEIFPRKDANAQRKPIRNAVALCAFASLRESSSYQVLSCKPIGDVGFSKTFAVLLGLNASKTGMDFFQKHWEQKRRQGCLRASLYGKGQNLLTALIPAPGGDQ